MRDILKWIGEINMARAASKPKKEISMEEALWKSADKLRGSVEPAEYKHVVLSLFFLKFASDKFEAQRKAIALQSWLLPTELIWMTSFQNSL